MMTKDSLMNFLLLSLSSITFNGTEALIYPIFLFLNNFNIQSKTDTQKVDTTGYHTVDKKVREENIFHFTKPYAPTEPLKYVEPSLSTYTYMCTKHS